MFERFARSARVAVVLAQEEARELSAEEIRPEHLLVGVLQSAGRGLSGLLGSYGLTAESVRGRLEPSDDADDPTFEDDAEALRAIGIDLHAVRDKIARTFGEDAWNNALRKSGRRRRRYGHLPFTKASKKALELALREALAHKDSTIGCEHVVLGILRSGDRSAVGLITEHVDADRLREEVVGLLDEAA
ncbi:MULTISPECIES: Clp protease N-terminal domain-containing protein [unclassified Mycobacterium]|uniref:Clp protease N-terminal domain-containing protein n=1 Tax=unclassified Mycobacterium TaxID=2642494 RepID=UPI0007405389|nr:MULTISPECIES: Clp protease N-terminal domain-containing protein [unclassified Mycobacterium]KUH87978.1 Clp protease [Mycobacterium sp. GA-1999]KUH88324.1 Clp protease [Mycobacterium sp. GA-0227b]